MIFMSLKARITSEMKDALKSGQKEKVGVLRMLNARILEKEVELRTSKGRDYHLNDEEVIETLTTYAKQRRQSIDSYREAGREELATKEERELSIVQEFLPQPLIREEIEAIVTRVISETGASGLKDLGAVMKAVMSEVKGAAEGKEVNQIVKERLLAISD